MARFLWRTYFFAGKYTHHTELNLRQSDIISNNKFSKSDNEANYLGQLKIFNKELEALKSSIGEGSSEYKLLVLLKEKVEEKYKQIAIRIHNENLIAKKKSRQEYEDLSEVLFWAQAAIKFPESDFVHQKIQQLANKLSTRTDFILHVLAWIVFLLLLTVLIASMVMLCSVTFGAIFGLPLVVVPLLTPFMGLMSASMGSFGSLTMLLMLNSTGFGLLLGYLYIMHTASLSDVLADLSGSDKKISDMLGNDISAWILGDPGVKNIKSRNKNATKDESRNESRDDSQVPRSINSRDSNGG